MHSLRKKKLKCFNIFESVLFIHEVFIHDKKLSKAPDIINHV